jgi:hypothetical protein
VKAINNELISGFEEFNEAICLLNHTAKNAQVAGLKAETKELQSIQELDDWVRGLIGSLPR